MLFLPILNSVEGNMETNCLILTGCVYETINKTFKAGFPHLRSWDFLLLLIIQNNEFFSMDEGPKTYPQYFPFCMKVSDLVCFKLTSYLS